jgi:membrane protein DedA with SNARE-associated domain
MNLPWFKRNGIFFVPISIIGWLILVGALVYAVYCFEDIDSRSHSVSVTLMNFVFNLIIIGVVYSIVAFFSSNEMKEY